ncbi:hypothetical protein CL617_00125 [archaeon]|nr:hypothetical protein [archaeon]|tara:strand:- start:388 stop:1278 length:891 start_codon:yes stop_codon:yes gene_type:complete
MTFKESLFRIYEEHYKKLLLIPIVIFVLCLIILGVIYAQTGSVIDRDVSLKGGIEVTLLKENLDFDDIENALMQEYSDVSVRELTNPLSRKSVGISIQVSDVSEEEITKFLKTKIDFDETNKDVYAPRNTESEFGENFYKSLLIVVLIGFILMALSVIIAFRTLIPSIAVISAAVMDIVFALTVASLIGIKLDGGAIVAFLLVIGYSVDTDILLTTKMIKRKEDTLMERMFGSMKTGLTMTISAIVALSVGYFVSLSSTLENMFLIIVLALIMDILTTYFTNAGILIWYAKKKGIQ